MKKGTKKKFSLFSLIILICIGIVGYPQIEKIRSHPEDNLAVIYSMALDSFMSLDSGLNSNMKYIAINTKTLKESTEEDKKKILDHLKKYNVEVIDASFEDLKEKGLFDSETHSLEGVLLEIDSLKITFNKEVIIEGSKYRSRLGAIDAECRIIYKNGAWKVKKSEITAIS